MRSRNTSMSTRRLSNSTIALPTSRINYSSDVRNSINRRSRSRSLLRILTNVRMKPSSVHSSRCLRSSPQSLNALYRRVMADLSFSAEQTDVRTLTIRMKNSVLVWRITLELVSASPSTPRSWTSSSVFSNFPVVRRVSQLRAQ